MIPMFGFIYWYFLNSSFYAPYARLEAAAATDTARVGQIIDSGIRRGLNEKLPSIGGNQVIGFSIVNLTPGDGATLKFQILVDLSDKTSSSSGYLVTLRCAIQAGDVFERYGLKVGNQESIRSTFVQALVCTNSQMPEYFSSPREAYVYDGLLPTVYFEKIRGIPLMEDENKAVVRLLEGLNGNPTSISQSFWRMVYFSTTVITTIGFGDIVPMTPAARFAVALEGILGIVLAGLFINSAVRRTAD